MKVLIEILIVVLLILAGWRQSYSEHLARLFPNAGLIQTTHGPASSGGSAANTFIIPPSSPTSENQWGQQRKHLEEPTR